MTTASAAALPAGPFVELTDAELVEIYGGFIPPLLYWGIAAYLGKTVGDNWGEFKEGVVDGFNAVTG